MDKKLKIIIGILIGVLILSVAYTLAASAVAGTMVKKPAVYLYPEEDSFVNVSLRINGEVVVSIPDYNSGWKVFATIEGLIDGEYDYLFYENTLNDLVLPDEGWIVAYDELEAWLDVRLVELGLNDKEVMQFKEYWMAELPEENYYEIKMLSGEFLAENMELIVEPRPDSVIRVLLNFEGLDEVRDIVEPIIVTPRRNGFTVVEWGGILN